MNLKKIVNNKYITIMRKSIIALIALTTTVFASNAQGTTEIGIEGSVYTQTSDSTQAVVPFATLTFFDASDHQAQRCFIVCNADGFYEIGAPYDYKSSYYVTVEAPGYESRGFILDAIPDGYEKCAEDSYIVNISMSAIADAGTPKMTSLPMSQLSSTATTVKELIASLPGIENEGNDWFTADDGSVAIFFNNYPSDPRVLQYLDRFPVGVVQSVDMFDIPEGGIYEKAIRVNSSMLPPHHNSPSFPYTESRLIGK